MTYLSFLGEESYQPGMRLGPGPTFVVDPIDGTTNFIHANGTGVCVSMALCKDRVPVVGVIYNPFTDALYSAIRGQGSFLNRKTRLPLKSPVPPLTGLNAALVAVEWGSDRSGNNWDVKVNTFKNLGQQGKGMVHSMRSLGSAALNFCAVASGVIDIYWEAGCWAWDVAAGWLILEESGGLVADANPGGSEPGVDGWKPAVDSRRYLAVRACGEGGRTQKEIVEEFWGQVAGRFEYQS